MTRGMWAVGQWTVYATGVYAYEWPDEDLQGAPRHGPYWSFQLTWPRVDAPRNPLRDPGSRDDHAPSAGTAYDALAARAHKVMADWAVEGWDRYLEVRLTGLNECYLSAGIAGSTYTGGAHRCQEWKAPIAELYRQRLEAIGPVLAESPLSESGLDSKSGRDWLFTNDVVITDRGLRFVEQESATRNETIPAIDLSWNDLAPWLIPGADCAMPPAGRSQAAMPEGTASAKGSPY